jgi:hypothetical protein
VNLLATSLKFSTNPLTGKLWPSPCHILSSSKLIPQKKSTIEEVTFNEVLSLVSNSLEDKVYRNTNKVRRCAKLACLLIIDSLGLCLCNESSGLAVWLFPLNRQLKDPLLKVISLYCSYMKVDQPTWYLDSSSRHTNNNQYI